MASIPLLDYSEVQSAPASAGSVSVGRSHNAYINLDEPILEMTELPLAGAPLPVPFLKPVPKKQMRNRNKHFASNYVETCSTTHKNNNDNNKQTMGTTTTCYTSIDTRASQRLEKNWDCYIFVFAILLKSNMRSNFVIYSVEKSTVCQYRLDKRTFICCVK